MNFVSIPEAYGFTSIAQAERDEGIIEGLRKGKREMAKSLLNQGVSVQVISAASGLSVEEIKQL